MTKKVKRKLSCNLASLTMTHFPPFFMVTGCKSSVCFFFFFCFLFVPGKEQNSLMDCALFIYRGLNFVVIIHAWLLVCSMFQEAMNYDNSLTLCE